MRRGGAAVFKRTTALAARAASALVIRRAAAPLLLHGVFDSEAWSRAAEAADEAWRLFLRIERCAFPLQQALSQAPGTVSPAAPFRAVLSRAAQLESARILVVRTHVRTAAMLAASAGFRVLVLKGGVMAGGDNPIDLSDLDVLVAKDQAGAVASALRDLGWTSSDQSSDRVSHILLSRDVPLEIHHALGHEPIEFSRLWDRSALLDGLPPLRQLGPVDHLRHVVSHLALQHPNRRTRLRDLMLVAHAARRCSSTEAAAAFADAASSYTAAVSRATLDAATGQANAQARHDEERLALAIYALAARPRLRLLPHDISQVVDVCSITMLQTAWERRAVWATAQPTDVFRPSSRPYVRAIEDVMSRRSAAVARAWRVAVRTAYRAVASILALALSIQARRTVKQALESPSLLKP